MKLNFKWRSGNSYSISDDKIEADAELLGGGEGMLIRLLSIKAVSPENTGMSASVEDLANYLGDETRKQKRLGAFVIIHKGRVLYSLDKTLKGGEKIDTSVVRQIALEDYSKII